MQTQKVEPANVKAQEKSMEILYKKFEKEFELAYSKELNEINEDQFIDLLAEMRFIEKEVESDVNLGH